MSDLAIDRPLVVYHGPNCQDGWLSAVTAHSVLGDDADYLPASYGQPPPYTEGKRVFILDFSFEPKEMARIAADCASLVWLDHHDDAKRQSLAALFAQSQSGKVQFRFNPKKCGARLAWEYFHPEQEPPYLVDVVESRDLWSWKAPFSREVDAWLSTRPRTFAEWGLILDRLERPWLDLNGWRSNGLTAQARQSGRTLLDYKDVVVAAHVKTARLVEMFGYTVPCCNATTLASEVGAALAEGAPFSATYKDRADGMREWSLRCSSASVLDMAHLASLRGGGGHRCAAGFQERISSQDEVASCILLVRQVNAVLQNEPDLTRFGAKVEAAALCQKWLDQADDGVLS